MNNITHSGIFLQQKKSNSLTKILFIAYGEPMNELTVILKDSERTYRQKFLVYESYSVSDYDPLILKCIEEAKKNFVGEPENIQIKIHMEIQ